MECTDNIKNRFREFEDAMTSCLPKVDKKLIIELLGDLKEDEYPGYNLQIKLREGFNETSFRESILKDMGVVPAFHQDEKYGGHAAVEHRVNFKTLTYLNNMNDISYIRGSRAGGGRASIGPQLDRDEHDKIYGPSGGKA
ncbi:hypothetical protein [Candidatus Nitrosocosmicus hydrocola]|uniref:hypothetical protein n=1 Tax=Candidatus Nitrosocosmicus hydrocola TaxID=1826872 RepID=UPI0011E5D7FC|nr:hypothetical protein [Candidatus Nitrosocosmicus hydrocola]